MSSSGPEKVGEGSSGISKTKKQKAIKDSLEKYPADQGIEDQLVNVARLKLEEQQQQQHKIDNQQQQHMNKNNSADYPISIYHDFEEGPPIIVGEVDDDIDDYDEDDLNKMAEPQAAYHLQPVALLVDELRSDSTNVRVQAVQRLRTIALALGQERSRRELVPFLLTSLDDEDEVLVALAEQLDPSLVEYLGGPAFAHLLIPILEGLASADETIVRQKALASFESLLPILSPEQISVNIMGAVRNLTGGDWFARKTSAACLGGLCAPFLGPSDFALLLGLFHQQLICDDSPTVRKAATQNLARLIQVVESDGLVAQEIIPMLEKIINDPQDSVRVHVIEPFVGLLERLLSPEEGFEEREHLLALLSPLYGLLEGDQSWRIQHVLASHFGRISRALKDHQSDIDPMATFCALLDHHEPEVRATAAGQLAAVAETATAPQIHKWIIPIINVAAMDESPHVKAALARQLNTVSLSLGPQQTLNHLLPVILRFLHDESSEVRLNVIAGLETTVQVIGIDQLHQTLLPAISKLSTDPQWRVRRDVVEHMPSLARLLGQDRFDAGMVELVLSWLDDPVWEVRKTAAVCIGRIVKGFQEDNGSLHSHSDWLFQPEPENGRLASRLLALANHPNYLRRQILVRTIEELVKVVGVARTVQYLLPTLVGLARDPIANVRFAVAKALEHMLPPLLLAASESPTHDDHAMEEDDDAKVVHRVDSIIKGTVIPLLQELNRDADEDVVWFSEQALRLVPYF